MTGFDLKNYQLVIHCHDEVSVCIKHSIADDFERLKPAIGQIYCTARFRSPCWVLRKKSNSTSILIHLKPESH